MRAQVILMAGPSGAGKSHLARRCGLPILQLDNYYKSGDDETLPRFTSGAVNWDDVGAWNEQAALGGIRELCHTGRTRVPRYDISANAAAGYDEISLQEADCFIAEGIFAAELISGCTREGSMAAAICVRRSRWVTLVLRGVRDLREHRKPPLVLLRRGWWLARREPEIVAALVARGCEAMTPREAERMIVRLSGGSRLPD